MINLYLIRHGMTEGNKFKRYIGTTDEPLCDEGRSSLKELHYPTPQLLFVSPLLRCRQTAEILFPGIEQRIVKDLRETDFGDFENKNYMELSDNPDYQKWIDSNGMMPFPNGESPEEVRIRCERGLKEILSICEKTKTETAAMVAHGGTIKNLMFRFADPKRGFYDWQAENGSGFLVQVRSLSPISLKLKEEYKKIL